jgi:hypothetical protein
VYPASVSTRSITFLATGASRLASASGNNSVSREASSLREGIPVSGTGCCFAVLLARRWQGIGAFLPQRGKHGVEIRHQTGYAVP